MAYQTRGRDPLLDSTMQAALEKRSKELLGLGLIVLGALALALVWSYAPTDPSLVSATDEPVQNWLGRVGAGIAAPVIMVVGFGGLGVGLVLVAWGLRFMLHQGAERAVGRLIFAPIWVALLSIYASTMVTGAEWTHSFSYGGMFGDTALSALLNIMPVGAAFVIKTTTFVIALAVVALGFFVLGFEWSEVRAGLHFLGLGLVVLYALLLRVLGQGAALTAQGARGLGE